MGDGQEPYTLHMHLWHALQHQLRADKVKDSSMNRRMFIRCLVLPGAIQFNSIAPSDRIGVFTTAPKHRSLVLLKKVRAMSYAGRPKRQPRTQSGSYA